MVNILLAARIISNMSGADFSASTPLTPPPILLSQTLNYLCKLSWTFCKLQFAITINLLIVSCTSRQIVRLWSTENGIWEVPALKWRGGREGARNGDGDDRHKRRHKWHNSFAPKNPFLPRNLIMAEVIWTNPITTAQTEFTFIEGNCGFVDMLMTTDSMIRT